MLAQCVQSSSGALHWADCESVCVRTNSHVVVGERLGMLKLSLDSELLPTSCSCSFWFTFLFPPCVSSDHHLSKIQPTSKYSTHFSCHPLSFFFFAVHLHLSVCNSIIERNVLWIIDCGLDLHMLNVEYLQPAKRLNTLFWYICTCITITLKMYS